MDSHRRCLLLGGLRPVGMVFRTNDGLVRGFSIGGILLGMLFYNHFVSPFFVKYLSLFFRKIMVILKKGLKKIVQAVKIVLYRL